MSRHRAIQIVVGYTLSVTPFVTAVPRLVVIKTEPRPFYTTVGGPNTSNRALCRAVPNSFTPTVCMSFQYFRGYIPSVDFHISELVR